MKIVSGSNASIDNEILAIKQLSYNLRMKQWLTEDIHTWQWWLMLFMLLTPWLAFYKLVDRKRVVEILLYGTLVIIITVTLDELGGEMMLWHYNISLFPLFPDIPWIDYSSMPVIYMLVYQYCHSWKSFLCANIAVAATFSWILEPILVKIDIYQPLNWSHSYSFPIYIVIALFWRWVVKKLLITQKNNI